MERTVCVIKRLRTLCSLVMFESVVLLESVAIFERVVFESEA